MHAATGRSLRFASIYPARLIAGRRYQPRHIRSFQSSSKAYLDLFPWTGASPDQKPSEDEKHAESDAQQPHAQDAPLPPEVAKEVQVAQARPSSPRKERSSSHHGSGRRRAARQQTRPKDVPPVRIPAEFAEKHVRRYQIDGPLVNGTLSITNRETATDAEAQVQKLATGGDDGRPSGSDAREAETSRPIKPHYGLSDDIGSEVLASISAGFALPRPQDYEASEDTFASRKVHTKLLCPIDGGIYFLDKVVEEAATNLGADVIHLDPTTIADIAGEYVREGADATSNALWTLGYDTAQVYRRREPPESTEDEHDAEEGEQDEDDGDSTMSPPRFQGSFMVAKGLSPALSQLLGIGGKTKPMVTQLKPDMLSQLPGFEIVGERGPSQRPVQWDDLKLREALESMLDAASDRKHDVTTAAASDTSDRSEDSATESSSTTSTAKSERKTIVLVKDFYEMIATTQGRKVVDRLVDIITRRRKDGARMVIVGTSSSAELAQTLRESPSAQAQMLDPVEALQAEGAQSVFRTTVVPPTENKNLYEEESRRRVQEINMRHLHSMCRRLDPATNTSDQLSYDDFAKQLQHLQEDDIFGRVDQEILTMDEVHRIIFYALGKRAVDLHDSSTMEALTPENVQKAMSDIENSDSAKATSLGGEVEKKRTIVIGDAVPSTEEADAKSKKREFEDRLRKIRKTCNTHEKKLLNGVVNPTSISTAFSDVHAEPTTIEALKTLTTLSLRRPEAFKYGVLAKDKLNGLLLYGPPGTGKTLLAKAVAKESGATMLEVSGGDVYDMYVGEGEKNVRAVFSLAKKLAPCVVFIDEADAIFASRGGGSNRNSHRELINQFLREWDGMTETSAFIMVATNRPFDLDDAALRRLPRRLLVDLPAEKDREAILKIHLKDEALAEDVDLPKLAADTPLYSGSDLKNLAVAAALTAVREEVEVATQYEAWKADKAKAGDPRFAASEKEQADTDIGSRDDVAQAIDHDSQPAEDRTADGYIYPSKRTLTKHHFDKAMEEISASVNEDMSSLGAVRKFDEKYGDRRGRKKKTSYGFSPGGNEEAREDTVKVRN